jgi:hypothetical protein
MAKPRGYPPFDGMPPTTSRQRLDKCLAGLEPADALSRRDRERVVRRLWSEGWTDVEIAVHTRMTTYTTGRIRGRLGLAAHQDLDVAS